MLYTDPVKKLDLSGMRFGRLMALEPTTVRNQHAWLCVCDCGVTLPVIQAYLRCGDTQSCGCLKTDRTREALITHGEAPLRNQSREYVRWQHAKQRCYNPKAPRFGNYAGRGIVMSSEWRDDFGQFLKDMGRCPVGHSLGRIDNDGPYSAQNCRWETLIDQQNNTRRNHLLTFNDTTKTAAQWSRVTGLPAAMILDRIGRRGWTIERALTTPIR